MSPRAAGDPRILAVDIGATKTLVTLRSLSDLHAPGAPSERFVTLRDPAAAVDAIAAAVARLTPAGAGPLAAAGLVAPGPLDAATGRILDAANLGWRQVPLAPMLAERLGIPVALEDDATAAALGEALAGAGVGADPFAYLTVSSGVGAGIVAGGRSLRGAHGVAGEVGHLVIDPSGPRCACGRRGDVEAYAGGAALARRARLTWPRARLADGRPAPRDAAAIFRLARTGDRDAQQLAEDAARALGAAIAALAASIDPAVIAVGGSIGLAQPALIRRAAAHARRTVLPATATGIRVVPAALGEASCAAGAAILGARLLGG